MAEFALPAHSSRQRARLLSLCHAGSLPGIAAVRELDHVALGLWACSVAMQVLSLDDLVRS